MIGIKHDYLFELEYSLEGQTTTITSEFIKVVSVIHDFDNNNMPMMFMTIAIDKKLLAKISKNVDRGIFIINFYKKVSDMDISIPILVFREEFIYFLSPNLEVTEGVDYTEEDENRQDLFVQTNIGFLMLDHVNLTRARLNGIIKDTSMQNIIYSFLSNRPVLIERFKSSTELTNLIIPPVSSISKSLYQLNNIATFYNTLYRFYADYDCTYLISSSGKGVPKKGEDINSVMIYIEPAISDNTVIDGMIINDKQKIYELYISTHNKAVINNKSQQLSYNKIRAIGTTDAKSTTDFYTEKFIGKKEKLSRLPNSNTDLLDNMKYNIEDNTIFVDLNKTGIDTTVFTINKEYYIKFNTESKQLSGNYLLSRKDEVYQREKEFYTSIVRLLFRRKGVVMS